MVRNPCASTAGAACRGFAGGGQRVAGTRTVSRIRTVSTSGTAARSPLPRRPNVRYPPTPAATTRNPITAGARDRRRAGGAGLRAFADEIGVVGAPVISVGASAVVRERGRAAPRDLAGAATGCSGQTAVANSSIEI